MDLSFFDVFNFEKIHSSSVDEKLNSQPGRLICLFFWGHDCPNCEVAKRILIGRKAEVDLLDMKWYQANIYDDFDLATRYGLFGIPVFMFFKNGKKLGKISPFPGFEPFFEAASKLL